MSTENQKAFPAKTAREGFLRFMVKDAPSWIDPRCRQESRGYQALLNIPLSLSVLLSPSDCLGFIFCRLYLDHRAVRVAKCCFLRMPKTSLHPSTTEANFALENLYYSILPLCIQSIALVGTPWIRQASIPLSIRAPFRYISSTHYQFPAASTLRPKPLAAPKMELCPWRILAAQSRALCCSRS